MAIEQPHTPPARQTDFLTLAAFLIAVVGIWSFLALAYVTSGGAPVGVDRAVIGLLRDPASPRDAIGPWWMEAALRDITALGSFTVAGVAALLVVGFLLTGRRYADAAAVAFACTAGMLLSPITKALFNRPRPGVEQHLVQVFTSSFPSGHALVSAVVYLTLGATLARMTDNRRRKLFFVGAAVCVALAAGSSRVYLGVHYASDVLAGWTVGTSWAIACWLVTRRLQHNKTLGGGAS